MPTERPAPTHDGVTAGVDAGWSWAFEDPREHWDAHDARQVRYWRSRPPAERLDRAAEYRVRRHGAIAEPATWSWRFLGRGEQ